jgi:glutathione S-transferase
MNNTPAIKLYRHALSGHSHRVELFLSLLGLNYETIDVDLMNGEHKSPEFLSKNRFGQVPVIDDGGLVISDSNAILVYLARKYDAQGQWLPNDPKLAAQVQRFLSVAAGQIASGPASARLVTVFGADLDHQDTITKAHHVLEVLDVELSQQHFLAGDSITIADIAVYTYVAHAPEGNVSLEAYTHVRTWLARIETMPGFIPMASTAVGLAA